MEVEWKEVQRKEESMDVCMESLKGRIEVQKKVWKEVQSKVCMEVYKYGSMTGRMGVWKEVWKENSQGSLKWKMKVERKFLNIEGSMEERM